MIDFSIEEIVEMNVITSVQDNNKEVDSDIDSLYETDESLMDLY